MEDQKIINALWTRTEAAIDWLRDKYGRRLQSIAMNILGNRLDAEEAVSDTYLPFGMPFRPPGRIRCPPMYIR